MPAQPVGGDAVLVLQHDNARDCTLYAHDCTKILSIIILLPPYNTAPLRDEGDRYSIDCAGCVKVGAHSVGRGDFFFACEKHPCDDVYQIRIQILAHNERRFDRDGLYSLIDAPVLAAGYLVRGVEGVFFDKLVCMFIINLQQNDVMR